MVEVALAARGSRSSPALRSIATAFLRRRPLIVAPMFATVVATLLAGPGPRNQVVALAGFGVIALGFFSWEAWRGRARLVSDRGLLTSLVITLGGITVAVMATGGASSPLLFLLFAPTVVGFAAFGRGPASNLLFGLGCTIFLAAALLPTGFPFPALTEGQRRLLVVVCAADALILLRVGVAALTDAHAAAREAAAGAGAEVVAAAAARVDALEAMGAKVAHEVRNPLSAIRGLVEVIAEKVAADERDRKRLGVVLSEVDRIDAILTGYLALARPLERIAPRPTDVGHLVREVAAITEARADKAGVSLTVEAAEVTATVDPQRLKEALLNLVLNAIQHTPAGGRIELLSAAQAGGVVVSIADSGTGMDAARLGTAATPFATGRPGGTGLGLALARQAIAQHGGTLELESAPGRGTVARVRLPLEAAEVG